MKYILIALLLASFMSTAQATGGRLLATGGVTTVEGSSGGGIVPWATLSGYAEDDEVSAIATLSALHLDDFDLKVAAASVNFYNRLELSVAQQDFNLTTLGAGEIRQQVFGAKYRIVGDLIYGKLPQFAMGIQYKRNRDFAVPQSIGSQHDDDFDIYLAASRAWLNGPFNRTWVASLTARATRANQMGLLGFGGDANNSHEVMIEGSLGIFLNRSVVVGVEYRQKPDNLAAVEEDDWMDVFVAWFPSKSVSLTAGWADLGDIAGFTSQSGAYMSIQASF
ncbi:DUF3034 domain-containing protein [Aliidiomarina minuta]|uniref:DUF3034 domain-containing protein n=1 Tax=Aliidiomarina minuta TaxID=880057 RepID=A0A432W5F2_9GAMM|nr:DUF3034 family protein [Aliidiomarina minuta]RUO25298.1 DUF3034 domain-containing protein [Aliidiomarina minuta]